MLRQGYRGRRRRPNRRPKPAWLPRRAPLRGSPLRRAGAPSRGSGGKTGDVLPTPFAERVLDLVGTIPPGLVLTYGDVAEQLGSRAPRAVGTALARFGGGVPWWRVVRAGGLLPPGHEAAAAEHLAAEGVAVIATAEGARVDLDRHRWRP
jgi:alkylated DNA nucleotide flippase Atl1